MATKQYSSSPSKEQKRLKGAQKKLKLEQTAQGYRFYKFKRPGVAGMTVRFLKSGESAAEARASIRKMLKRESKK